ncbi:hypothetical protein LZG04_17775 [Saccharothrix sp. S26]|uniref:hypothetical protein n=1 Tax=Saccharothrix sp. S26 TaxID=2907215 RepID=UPI001F301ED9|nr:hypothetical protein [Saccharothrix sp. S26]MCE6996638.1 hypothetical protein [Saccharothrix sp. S26]
MSVRAGTLLVDGIGRGDQFVGTTLARAGLIASRSGPARLTGHGRELLAAA